MVIIKNEAKGAVLKLVKDGNTTYVYFEELMNKIWDEYIRAIVDNVYVRGLLKDLQFTDTEIFHMLEKLQQGRTEYNSYDYLEVAYQ